MQSVVYGRLSRKHQCNMVFVSIIFWALVSTVTGFDYYENPFEIEEMQYKDEIENHRNVHLLPENCGPLNDYRTIGGEDAQLYEYPWLVLLQRKVHGEFRKFFCGGSLINPKYVLTAAHCIKGKNRQKFRVRVGEHDVSKDKACYGSEDFKLCESEVQDILISRIIFYPGYGINKKSLLENDIALLRLERPVNLTVQNAGVICLPVKQSLREQYLPGSRGIVAGWGQIGENYNPYFAVLQKVEIPISSRERCVSLLGHGDENDPKFRNILCADEQGKGSCKGDSGGPLMILDEDEFRYVQYGIVSFGIGCGTDIPSVYTDVTKYMKWILDTIKP